MENNFILGVDPGLTGGICLLDLGGNVHWLINHEIKNGWINFWKCFNSYMGLSRELNGQEFIPVYIEKPYILSKQKGNEKIWRNYQTLMIAYEPQKEVRPQEWKKALNIPRGLSKQESLKYQLENLCPKVNIVGKEIQWQNVTKTGKISRTINDGLVDAYCIAEYARLTLLDIKYHKKI